MCGLNVDELLFGDLSNQCLLYCFLFNISFISILAECEYEEIWSQELERCVDIGMDATDTDYV